jgi:potassium-dependent mechanosensitive channel
MRMRRAWWAAARTFFVFAAVLLLAPAPLSPDAQAQGAASVTLDAIKGSLDEIERAVNRDDISAEELADLRQKLNAATEDLRAKIDEIEPRTQEVEERLKQLGPPPAKDAPPESPEVSKQREELTKSFSELDGALKAARVMSVRVEQLSERVAQKRHALYARELFARTPSALDPFFWSDVSRALPIELGRWRTMLDLWTSERPDGARAALAALLVLAIAGVAIAMSRWWFPWFSSAPRETISAKATTAFWTFIWFAARTPLASFAALLVLETFGLLTVRVAQIAQGLVAGIAAAAFGHGVARALYAPKQPERRLTADNDEIARCLHDHLVWGSRVLGVVIPLQIVHKTLFAPLVITIATNALFAAATAAILLHLAFRLGRLTTPTQRRALLGVIHPLAWLLSIFIVLALIAGYSGFAAFVSLRVIVAAVVFGALYLFSIATQAFLGTFAEETERGQKLSTGLGLSSRSLGLFGTLLTALVRVVLVLLAFFLIIGPWEVSTADLFDTIRNVPFGFKIGELHLSIRAMLVALVTLAVLLIITRIVQGWLERDLLPRTRIDAGLQHSIVTIFGYVGAITAITLALSGMGFDLQKIALIAGALSVGVGFGLQSIVSNFVSGLILLTERPIRVGDAIVVKGEEGWVRRVRVRATEIETYERASVIIPNSELITGVVKNWTHANRLARILIKVTVSYDSDPVKVRDILLEIAHTHPFVTQSPAPSAFLIGLGENGMEFDLFCIVADVDKTLAVKSELHYAILERFRAAGIEIPYPQRELRWRAQEEVSSPDAGRAVGSPATTGEAALIHGKVLKDRAG